MPFCDDVLWFFTSTRLDDVVTPSIVCSPDNVMLAVVAHATGALVLKPCATLSTYCLVANCNEVVGSCVTVTDVKPPKVKLVLPKEMLVVPMVNELFASIVFDTTPVPPVFTNTPATFGNIEIADPAAGDACKVLVPLTAPAKVI